MNENASPQASFSLVRVLFIILPVGVILLGALGYIRYGEEMGLTGTGIPEVVTVKGKVMMRGKPLKGGMIQTIFSDNASLQGGFGKINEDGTFFLETAVEAEIREGLFLGKHKIVIYNYLPTEGAAPGPLVTPVKYSTSTQTPLTLVVTQETADQPVKFTLDADKDTPTEAFVEEYMARVEEARAAAEESAATPGEPSDDKKANTANEGGR